MLKDEKDFGLNKDTFQVFLFTCPATIPFSFATHPWFVVNEQGKISRWEVLYKEVSHEAKWGHVYKDFSPPFQGITMFPLLPNVFWKGTLLAKLEGADAEQMALYIKNSPKNYPYPQKHFCTGPNSNTYAQWILKHFPKIKIELPWNAIGKSYPV